MTGVPSSAFEGAFDLLILDEISDGTLVFPSLILGGMFGSNLPSVLAKESSKIANVTYHLGIETKRQEMESKNLQVRCW